MVTVKRMSLPPDKTARPENAGKPAGGPHCFARSVVDTLAEEKGLEAVTIDPARQKISVATLGRSDVDQLTRRLTDKFQTARQADEPHGLLARWTASAAYGRGAGTAGPPGTELPRERAHNSRTRVLKLRGMISPG